MELKAYWLAIKAGWKIILGTLVVALAAAAVLSWPTTPQYVSSTSLFVAAETGSKDLNELYQRNAVASQRLASYVVLATSDSVADEVSKAVGFPVDSEVATAATAGEPVDVQSSVVEGSVIMQISVTDSDPERARDIATAYGEVLPQTIGELEQVRDTSGPQVQVRVIDAADLPTSPLPTPVLRNLMAALILGLGAGVGLAVLRYVLAADKTHAAPGADAA